MDEVRKLRQVRSLRIGNWLLVPIYVFLLAIPLYYEWKAEIPPIEQLKQTEGQLTYRLVGRKGPQIGIKGSDGTHYYTCRPGLITNKHDCFIPRQDLETLKGHEATVWWFEQQIYLYSKQRRLVRLVVEGKDYVDVESTDRQASRASRWAPRTATILLLSFVSIAVYFERVARRIERGLTALEDKA